MSRWTVALGACVAAFLVTTARAAQEQLLEEARRLVAEAKPLVEKANDVDLEMEARKAPRKEAFQKLKQARKDYDDYLDANPSMEDKIDKEYCDAVALLFWIKKDSSLGELEKDAPAPELPQAPGAGPAPPPSGSNPAPPGNGGASNPPAPAPGPGSPPAPSDLPERAKRQFSAIGDYEKAHPGDLPLLKQFYERFLADFPDPSLPEYGQAMDNLGKINDRMKNVFKEVAKRDADSIASDDSKAEKSIFGRLTQDFNSKDPDVRRRAASMMAASRARAATYFLAKGLTDKDGDLARICHDGLVAIGGTNTGKNLVEFYRDAQREKQQAAMEVLTEVTKKGPIDAATLAPFVGKFALSNDPDVSQAAIYLLTNMGRAGGPGLIVALDTKLPDKKVAVINAIVAAKYYRGATNLADRFLVTSNTPDMQQYRKAAMDGLETMGGYAVPYLIPFLHSESQQYTAFILGKITGEPISFTGAGIKRARDWWESNKAKFKED
jgi:hypothetical protein